LSRFGGSFSMALDLIDFDPLSGQAIHAEWKSDGSFILHHSQDVRPFLERTKALQNDDDYTRKGFKEEWWHYASIPNVLIEKWKREKGVDLFNKAHRKKVFELLNDPEYRFLKATSRKHTERSE
jgi:hypothetical protein